MQFVIQLAVIAASLYVGIFVLKLVFATAPAVFSGVASATRTLIRDSSERAEAVGSVANRVFASTSAPKQVANKTKSSEALPKRGAAPLVESEGVSKIVSRFDGVLSDAQVVALSDQPAFIRKSKGQLGHA